MRKTALVISAALVAASTVAYTVLVLVDGQLQLSGWLVPLMLVSLMWLVVSYDDYREDQRQRAQARQRHPTQGGQR